MKPPRPDNPAHPANLCQIPLLETQGFRGTDASLEVSIFENGLVWRELGEDILFVYFAGEHADPPDNNGVGGWSNRRYDCCRFPRNLDVAREFNWIDLKSFLSWNGVDLAVWPALPLHMQIGDLLEFYGRENIFGTSNGPLFEIRKPGEYAGFFDRFDVCEAHAVLEWHYNRGGLVLERPSNFRRNESTGVQLARLKFRPRPNLEFNMLSVNGREIYRTLEHRYGFDAWDTYEDPAF